MSRSSKGFADFFPTAPSVLKDKKRGSDPERNRHDSPAHHSSGGSRDRHSSSQGTPRYSPHSTPRAGRDDRYPSDSRNGVSSSSSYTTSSTVFDSRKARSSEHTPLSHMDSASPARAKSPSRSRQDGASSADISREVKQEAATPEPRQARPGKGKVKCVKTSYDPEMDRTIGSKEKRTKKPVYEDIGSDNELEAEDPRLRIQNYTSGRHNHARARLRPAPYTLKSYEYDPQTTVNGGPPTRICVTGLDTLTPATSVERLFSSFGDVAECNLAHNPKNGSSLGICILRFRDSKRGGVPNSAARAAKRAHEECKTGQHRIGQNTLRAVLDRDGTLGREIVLKKLEELKPKPVQRIPPPPPPPPAQQQQSRTPLHREEPPRIRPTAPPPDAPRGPSGRGGRVVPTGPSVPSPSVAPIIAPVPVRPDRPGHLNLIEDESVLNKIARDPYIFLSHECVPVLSTTIPHLKARMKKFDVKDVRADKTGYFIIFRDSKAGEEECARCYQACHLQPMFTYTMELECQKYGNPDYERPPSPETVQAEERRKAAEERRKKEAAVDYEEEKLLRAVNIDPVKAVVEALRVELKAKLLEDVKARIAGPALYEFLDPSKHVERRNRLGIAGPDDNKQHVLLDRNRPSPIGTPEYGNEYLGRRPLKSKSINLNSLPKMRKGQRQDLSAVFLDERRKQKPSARRIDIRGLHHRLHQEEDDSDDERSNHRDDRDSRTVSRMSPAVDTDDEDPFQSGRRPKRPEPAWGGEETEEEEEEEDEEDQIESSVETPQPEIDPRIVKLNQLQAELDSLAPRSKKRKRLLEEIAEQKRIKLDAQGTIGQVRVTPEVRVTDEDAKPKAKKKTKKQLLEEQQSFDKAKLLEEFMAKNAVEEVKLPEPTKTPEPRLPIDMPLVDGVRTGITTGGPKRSVEDDPNLVADLDGYQALVKDDEDFQALQLVLAEETAADLGDVALWSWKQKQIKQLNRGGETGPSVSLTSIPGYYVPNQTGCARTEGTKPISQSEKSKYLPHRIKVQKAREERERLAKLDPAVAAAVAAKEAQAANTAKSSSRSNRIANRRLVADIAAHKSALASSGDGDSLKFNQLKKRKKPVRFARSAIHGWGLYAMENINQNEMIIEYVGDRVRQQVADVRERNYIRTGIGSSYLFRIDDYTIIDATKKGGIARFINHSCTPNCTAKIIKVDSTKRIVIYALRDVQRDEELTYDYKFEREWDSDDRIPCLCGSTGCKGFLN